MAARPRTFVGQAAAEHAAADHPLRRGAQPRRAERRRAHRSPTQARRAARQSVHPRTGWLLWSTPAGTDRSAGLHRPVGVHRDPHRGSTAAGMAAPPSQPDQGADLLLRQRACGEPTAACRDLAFGPRGRRDQDPRKPADRRSPRLRRRDPHRTSGAATEVAGRAWMEVDGDRLCLRTRCDTEPHAQSHPRPIPRRGRSRRDRLARGRLGICGTRSCRSCPTAAPR